MLENFVLADHSFRMFDQILKQAEYLRFNGDFFAVHGEAKVFGIECVVAKPVNRRKRLSSVKIMPVWRNL